jgi:putative membrane protein
LSSTSSSSETRHVDGPSSTEALAARYRHLFILPSNRTLLVYLGVVSLVLSATVVGARQAPAAFIASFVMASIASFAIAKASKLADSASIASFRRSAAAVMAGELLWFIFAAAGAVYALFQQASRSTGNAFFFGGFICAGFEFLVINGVFIERSSTSVVLSAVHPLATAAAFSVLGAAVPDGLAVALGLVAFVIIASFTVALKRRKTSRGYNAVRLLQAFMKTWADDNPSELEGIIAAHSSKATVTSKVLRFQQDDGDTFVILPGVHPGPFYPVGSYNLPGLLSTSFDGLGRVMTLHRPGGHENNLATNADAKKYCEAIKTFALTVRPAPEAAKMRGPMVSKVGKATASTSAFGKDLLLTISFAPYGSDDLETEAEGWLAGMAAQQGYDASVVDAHNSIDSGREAPDLQDEGWTILMRGTGQAPALPFRLGYAHSSEVGFETSGDLTANGLALMLFEVDGTKWALVLADANNAVPALREAASRALEAAGFRLLEFCTSDSHDLAARGLTVDRGYHALGEATQPDSIVSAAVKLAAMADSRLSSCRYGSGKLTSELDVFGSRALNEFAAMTQRSSRFAKAYAAFAGLSALVLFAVSLVA